MTFANAAGAGGAAAGMPGMPGMPDMGGMGNIGNMMGMFNNPQFMNMATQLMSDPQMQNVMSNLVTNMFQPGQEGAPAEGAAPGVTPGAETTRAEGANPPVGPGFEQILNSAQQFAQNMNTQNPEFVAQMRERMNLNPTGEAPKSADEEKKRIDTTS